MQAVFCKYDTKFMLYNCRYYEMATLWGELSVLVKWRKYSWITLNGTVLYVGALDNSGTPQLRRANIMIMWGVL